jgi:hypothetical protein
VRLRIDRSGGQHGSLAGAWWPDTLALAAELPGLIAGVDAWLAGRTPGRSEQVSSVGVGWHAWNQVPDRAQVGGRRVRVGWFSSIDVHTVSVSCPNGDHYDLLVVPPDSLNDTASAVMTAAADAGNSLGGSEILLRQAGGYEPVSLPVDAWHDPESVLAEHPEWETDSGSITGDPPPGRDPAALASTDDPCTGKIS